MTQRQKVLRQIAHDEPMMWCEMHGWLCSGCHLLEYRRPSQMPKQSRKNMFEWASKEEPCGSDVK